MNRSQLSDENLWEAIVMDDSRAFAELYNRYWKRLYKTALYYLKDQEAAQQILNDVFVVLWNRRQHLHIESFANYLFITTKYHVFKALHAAKSVTVEYVEEYQEQAEHSMNEAEKKSNYNDLLYDLDQYLQGLPKRCKEIFWMSRIENLSNQEIAARFGISKRTVENQITHASKHLKTSYKELTLMALLTLITQL
jgi:RNA polymerase sigma-70 factor (ECF subfamily)